MHVSDQKIYKHQCVPISQIEICYILYIAGSPTMELNVSYVDVFNVLKLPRAPPLCLLKILLSIPKIGLLN